MRQVAGTCRQSRRDVGRELNRFECYFPNHVADVVKFVKEVNHPESARMMYDTFHAHIEGKDLIAALRAAAPYLVLVHISETTAARRAVGM